MRLIVGLGNPGEKYKNNRHNVGMRVVDELVKRNTANVTRSPYPELAECYMLPVTKTLVAKTNVFMNESGRAVRKLVTRYLVTSGSKETSRKSRVYESLYIVHDDLDIALGSFKVQKGKGPRQHNGVESVNEALGTKDYWHVRVGIENRPASVPLGGTSARRGKEYVLQDFTESEERILKEVIGKIEEDLCG